VSLVASQQAHFVRQFVHQWLATQPLQAPTSKYKTGPHCYNSGGVTDGQPLRWPYFVAICSGSMENTKH